MKTYLLLTILLLYHFNSQSQDSIILFKNIAKYERERDFEKGTSIRIKPEVYTRYIGAEVQSPLKYISYDFSTNIRIIDFTFKDTVQFKYTKFQDDIEFNNTRFQTMYNSLNWFEGITKFNKCTFNSPSFFIWCTFKHSLQIEDVRFNNVQFIYSNVTNGTFDKVNFIKTTSFVGTTFNDINKFTKCTFSDTVDFSKSNYVDNIEYYNTNFNGSAIFKNCIFNKSIDFSNSTFNNYCTFNSITLTDSSKFNFKNVTWADTIDFSEIQNIKNEIDFSISNFTNKKYYNKTKNSYQKHLINLYKTDISKLHIDYYHFKLLFVNPDDGNALSIDETKSIYEAVLKNFKDRGQMESYKLLDIEYKDYIGKTGGLLKNIFAKLSKYWDNYGYEKWWVFIWTILFIFIYTIITFFWFDTLSTSVYILDTISTQPNWKQLRNIGIKSSYGINLITARLWYSFIYTSAIFFLLWLKIDRLKYDKKLAMIYLILVYITGIICIAYMANYVLQK